MRHETEFVPSRLFVILALLVLFASPVAAQDPGVRIGASADPDQFFFGGHVETEPLVDRLRFRPNGEIGIGDGLTVIALNFEFAYHFPTTRPWGVYVGGGPALNIVSNGDTGAHGGFNLMVGAEHRGGLFAELKVGTIDSPDFKVGVGYIFH
jgi:hypothetical protein